MNLKLKTPILTLQIGIPSQHLWKPLSLFLVYLVGDMVGQKLSVERLSKMELNDWQFLIIYSHRFFPKKNNQITSSKYIIAVLPKILRIVRSITFSKLPVLLWVIFLKTAGSLRLFEIPGTGGSLIFLIWIIRTRKGDQRYFDFNFFL